jgi:purine-nucleoside phosphorylase
LRLTPDRNIKEAFNFIRKRTKQQPKIGVILGSGLGKFAEEIKNKSCISANDIPHFPVSTAPDHSSQLVIGKIGSESIIAFMGRIHLYESGSVRDILFPIAIAKRLGIRILIVTNAAGGINPDFKPGDLMLITDHINLTFRKVAHHLTSNNYHSEYYDRSLIRLALAAAEKEQIQIKKGIYCGLTGPSYETPAEIKMLRKLGADAVGMSTVNETLFARHLGLRLIGISCITNLSSGLSTNILTHEDVTKTAAISAESVNRLIRSIVIALNKAPK